MRSVASQRAGEWSPTDTDAIAYIARLSSVPSAERKYRIDTFIKALKAAGLWSKIDALWDLCAGSEADSLRNIKSTSFSLAKTGTVTFTPNIGANGDGSTGYLSTQFTPSTAGGQYAQNSATVGAFVNNPDIAANKFVVGTNNSTFGPRLRPAQVTSATYGVAGFINNGTAFTGTRKAKPTPVLASISRTASTSAAVYENGANTGSDANASTGNPTQAIWLMRNSTNYSSETLAFAYVGGGLNDAENAALWDAIRVYLNAVQRPIMCFGDSLTYGADTGDVQALLPWPLRVQTALGRLTYNGGVPDDTSTQIRARQIVETYGVACTGVIEAGRNNFTDPTTVKADIAAMVARYTTGRFIVIGVLPFTVDGDLNSANSITRLQLNADLAALYGGKYLDWLPSLQAANDGSANDLSDIANGWTPRSLRYDGGHISSTINGAGFSGIGVAATAVQAKIASLGY